MPAEVEQTNDLAKTWIRLHHLERRSPEREELFWAYERLDDLVSKAPEDAWPIIQAILRLDQSDPIIANLAAGPLENLLAKHGLEFIDRVEALARQDPQFRKLLGGVWQSSMTDAIWKRVTAVAGPRW